MLQTDAVVVDGDLKRIRSAGQAAIGPNRCTGRSRDYGSTAGTIVNY